MRPPIQDPTAGRTAQAIREDPGVPQAILDPTDPRCEELPVEEGERAGAVRRILDPTDPEFGAVA